MITRELVAGTHQQPHRFYADASDLGWAPGYFPEQVDTDLGNGLPFVKTDQDEDRIRYSQANGCITLVVFND